jgi:hypothetical protein
MKEIAPDEVVFFSEIWKDSVDGSYARQKRDANDRLMGIGDIAIDGPWLISTFVVPVVVVLLKDYAKYSIEQVIAALKSYFAKAKKNVSDDKIKEIARGIFDLVEEARRQDV